MAPGRGIRAHTLAIDCGYALVLDVLGLAFGAALRLLRRLWVLYNCGVNIGTIFSPFIGGSACWSIWFFC